MSLILNGDGGWLGPQIESRADAEPGFVVCYRGQSIVWVGPVEKLIEARYVDLITCHRLDLDEVHRHTGSKARIRLGGAN